VLIGFYEDDPVTKQSASKRRFPMGNFERGVEKKFKGDKVAERKYKTNVKQGASRLSQAAKLRKKASK
jgi:hypothetical protein